MSEHIEQTIADCENKIGQLTGLVEKLRWFQQEFPHTAAAVAIAEETPRRKYTRRKGAPPKKQRQQRKTTDRQTDRAKRGPRVSAVRSLPDGDDLTAKILAALERRSPLSPAELVTATKGDKLAVRKRVQALEQDGRVTYTGVTMSRQVHLGTPKGPAGSVSGNPSKRGESVKHTPAAAPSTSALDVVLDRDRQVLGKLEDAGRVGRTVRELQMSMPDDSQPALEQSLTRLKVKKRVMQDEDGRWRAT